MNLPTLSVTDFLSLVNQTMELAYPIVTVEGELADFRISKNRWLYFKLKDDTATISCFGTIYMLPGPLEEGMMIKVVGSPRHHLQYGFSFNVQSIAVSGEGSLKKAQDLLQKKLTAEGLFDPARKRVLPSIPDRIGLITSRGSAAEADFLKITGERWGGLTIVRRDSLVQGANAPLALVAAIKDFNELAEMPDVLVIIRGGGSQDDLAAFSDERVVRAVSGSRIPTLVAIGHEVDLSLAELAADLRASTPTNAAQLVVPDRQYAIGQAWGEVTMLGEALSTRLILERADLYEVAVAAGDDLAHHLHQLKQNIQGTVQLLKSYDPREILKQGYALVRSGGQSIKSIKKLKLGQELDIQMTDGNLQVGIAGITPNKRAK